MPYPEAATSNEASDATEAQCARVVDVACVMLVALDGDGRVEIFNGEAQRVTGYAADEVRGRSFVDALVQAGARPRVAAALGAGDPHDSVTCPISRRGGAHRLVELRIARDGGRLVLAGHDVTDARAAAAVRSRADRLAAVGTLAEGLAHEVRNPLNGARLHLTLLSRGLGKGASAAELHDAARVALRELTRIGALVDDFLEFARPRAVDRQMVDVAQLFARASEAAQDAAKSAGVSVSHDLPRSTLELSADADALEQVVGALLVNAIEAASPRSGGRVILRGRRARQAVILEVEDDGPGLAAPDAPVFDAFYTTKPNGTGLGLAIAHRLVSNHGGQLDVTSRPGKTVFRAKLPLISG